MANQAIPSPPPLASATKAGRVSIADQVLGAGKKSFSDILGLAKIATVSLPTASSYEGFIVYDATTQTLKYSNGTSWTGAGGSSGVTTMAAIGSSPNANGATISGTTLNLEPASGSYGGIVTTSAQTLGAGIKTIAGIVNTASVTYAYTEQTTTYAVLTTDRIINCTSGTFTVTLPTAVGVTGKAYVIKNSGTGTITIDTTSSQTIDGALTVTINVQYTSYHVVSNGANWICI